LRERRRFALAAGCGEHLKVLDQLDQELWYQSSEDYAKYARETLRKERALIERLGLLAK
jgi:hypothetical protein